MNSQIRDRHKQYLFDMNFVGIFKNDFAANKIF